MDTIQTLIDRADAPVSAFAHSLDRSALEVRTPAALATQADPRTSPTYRFLSSDRVIHALADAGFIPVTAAQTQSRRSNPLSARHVIRFRRRYESVQLRDCIPEILFLNGHDGRTAYLMFVLELSPLTRILRKIGGFAKRRLEAAEVTVFEELIRNEEAGCLFM